MADAIRGAERVRARRVLHPPDGCRDRQLLPRAGGGRARGRHRAGAAGSLGEPRQAVLQEDPQAARPTWARSGTSCSRCSRSRASTSAPTCATTASSSSSTARSRSWARRTSPTRRTTCSKNIKRGLHWVDLMVRLEGPVVASVNAVFLSDWYSETDEVLTDEIDLFDVNAGPGDLDCQIVPSGPGVRVREQPAAVPRAALLRAAPDHHRQPVLRARRGAAARDHDGLPARPRRSSCSSRRRATRRSSTTRSAATTRRCCAPA